jgi:hypothetical protein
MTDTAKDTITVGTIGSVNTDEEGNLTATVVNEQTATSVADALAKAGQVPVTVKYENSDKVSEVQPASASGQGYVPKFSDTFRTVIYILGVIVAAASFIILGIAADLNLPHYVTTLAGLVGTGFGSIAAAFGVAYNPNRLSAK